MTATAPLKSQSDTIDWEARRGYIGASETPVLLGIGRFKGLTPYGIWLQKTGQTPFDQDENPHTYWGKALEGVIRAEYAKRTGNEVTVPPAILHEKYAFVGANLDGASDKRDVEIKFVGQHNAHEWGAEDTNEIPWDYIIQVQKQMLLRKRPVQDLAALIGGFDFRIYTIEADKELQQMALEADINFWTRYVQPKTPPPLTKLADISRAYAQSEASVVNASFDVLLALQKFKQLKTQITALTAEKEAEEAIIKTFMEQNDTLTNDAGKVVATWKTSKSGSRIFLAK